MDYLEQKVCVCLCLRPISCEHQSSPLGISGRTDRGHGRQEYGYTEGRSHSLLFFLHPPSAMVDLVARMFRPSLSLVGVPS